VRDDPQGLLRWDPIANRSHSTATRRFILGDGRSDGGALARPSRSRGGTDDRDRTRDSTSNTHFERTTDFCPASLARYTSDSVPSQDNRRVMPVVTYYHSSNGRVPVRFRIVRRPRITPSSAAGSPTRPAIWCWGASSTTTPRVSRASSASSSASSRRRSHFRVTARRDALYRIYARNGDADDPTPPRFGGEMSAAIRAAPMTRIPSASTPPTGRSAADWSRGWSPIASRRDGPARHLERRRRDPRGARLPGGPRR